MRYLTDPLNSNHKCTCGHLWLNHDVNEYRGDGTETCCVEGCDQAACPGKRQGSISTLISMLSRVLGHHPEVQTQNGYSVGRIGPEDPVVVYCCNEVVAGACRFAGRHTHTRSVLTYGFAGPDEPSRIDMGWRANDEA